MASLLERKVIGSELNRDVRIAVIWSKVIGIWFLFNLRPIHMISIQIRALVASAEKGLELQHTTDKFYPLNRVQRIPKQLKLKRWASAHRFIFIYKKYWTHHMSKSPKRCVQFFYLSFCGAFFKKRPASFYLLASSTATATATILFRVLPECFPLGQQLYACRIRFGIFHVHPPRRRLFFRPIRCGNGDRPSPAHRCMGSPPCPY